MKTSELIRQLQEADPSGQEEVCVGNQDIWFVERMPAYYDGRLQVLIRDASVTCGFNIAGVEYRSAGVKIDLKTYSAEDGIWDDPAFVIKGDVPPWKQEELEKVRQEARSALLAKDAS